MFLIFCIKNVPHAVIHPLRSYFSLVVRSVLNAAWIFGANVLR